VELLRRALDADNRVTCSFGSRATCIGSLGWQPIVGIGTRRKKMAIAASRMIGEAVRSCHLREERAVELLRGIRGSLRLYAAGIR
jgi:hypothetical protein